MTQIILISGTMGSGKTTVLSEASDILSLKGVVHAAIDFDTLGIAHLPPGVWDDVTLRNLISVWANYRAAGVTRLLLAEALESATDLERVRNAIPDVKCWYEPVGFKCVLRNS